MRYHEEQRGRVPNIAICFLLLLLGPAAERADAMLFSISTPGGPVSIEVSHAGPSGDLVSPNEPIPPSFRPPSIFSAPLPSGSGARALGLGAFTAVADDATAASWNPGGLTQLERPEASFVLRYSRHEAEHFSDYSDFKVGENNYEDSNLNYLSAVLPFRLKDRNFVFSVNYQEVYDFEQRFTADSLAASTGSDRKHKEETYTATQVDHFNDGTIEMDITSHLTTHITSELQQALESDMLSSLEFEQEGIIDAATPALAFEVTPKLSLGAALNLYQDNMLGGHAIRSMTRASYSGTSDSIVKTESERTTEGTYSYDGIWHIPPIEIMPGIWTDPIDVPFSGEGVYAPFTDSSSSREGENLLYEGVYTEENDFDDLSGFNATFGALWTVTRHLSLGATIDLPWTADAEQTRTVKNEITTYDSTRTRVLNVASSSTTEKKDVEFRFPLYATAGLVWKWNNVLSSSIDAGFAQWSDFYYQAEGEPRINPLDGSPYGDHPIDDCWSLKYGMEYLWVLTHTEIPFRAGVSWEQRPAIGDPDEFWGFSLGTGVSVGKDPGKMIVDVAYSYARGEDVLGSLVPDRPDLKTDVTEHQLYLSGIWHF